MNHFLIGSLLIASIFAFVACDGTKQGQVETNTKADSIILKTDNPTTSSMTGVTPNPDRFPYIDVIDDSTLEFQAYTVKFKLVHQNPIVPVTSDKLYWIDENNSNEQVGVFATYMMQGREINLRSTQIRVDYFKKSLPGCSTTDSLFDWWQATQLTGPGAKVMKEQQMIKTAGGQGAEVMELFAVKQDSLSPKFLAIALLDYHDEYMIGLNLTAVDTFEYVDALPSFYKLLESFE
ncbi:hypothetical protein N9933_00855 [bacterium]|nr:hypothetical protein [bacterium]